jgi:hypothetical protein
VQAALSDGRQPAERRALQRCFEQRLGDAMLRGPLQGPAPAPAAAVGSPPAARQERTLQVAVEGCGALLAQMRRGGLFSEASLQRDAYNAGGDALDVEGWAMGGSTTWQYVVSGSVLVGGSQLAQDRTAATGQGAGLFPGQLVTAPLAAYLRQSGVASRIDEYFLDNRVGRPDPRTFSDPRYYSDVLLEVLAFDEK